MAFVIKNNTAGEIEIEDLGQFVEALQELDLEILYNLDEITRSVNSTATGSLGNLESLNTIDYLDGLGGSPIPPAQAAQVLGLTQDERDALDAANSPSAANAIATIADVSGGGLTEGAHEVLDTLTHLVTENAFEEIIESGDEITSVIIWTDSGKTKKIRETLYTYSGDDVATEVVKQYDGAGVLKNTLTGTFVYSGDDIANITWVKT